MSNRPLFQGQRFVRRRGGQQVKIEHIKQVIVMHGRTEQLSPRFRMSGTNEYITANQLRQQYDEEKEQRVPAAEVWVEGN